MANKIAIKKLTASDLTIFEYHYHNNPAGKQKAININTNILTGLFYPDLESNRHSVELFIYGPGLEVEYNLARKILKQEKNWRLNGEIIRNPDESLNRFDSILPGDIAVFSFNDGPKPEIIRLFLLSQNNAYDKDIHQRMSVLLDARSMISIRDTELKEITSTSNIPIEHPLNKLLLSLDIEDIVYGGSKINEFAPSSPFRPKISLDALKKAKDSASQIGLLGEQIIYDYLYQLRDIGHIHNFTWISSTDALSPYDFSLNLTNQQDILIDVKTTNYDFDKPIHISLPELKKMASGPERYDIYRVYNLSKNDGMLRIISDLRDFATNILNLLNDLPIGVSADGISVNPSILPYEEESIFLKFQSETDQ